MTNINFCHQSNHCPFQPFSWWHQNSVLFNCLLPRPKMVEGKNATGTPSDNTGLNCSKQCAQSCLTLCDPMDGAHQAPLSMEFSRSCCQEENTRCCLRSCSSLLKEMGIPDHLTCLLKNLYAGQEATVRTGHGTTDGFQIGKGVRQVNVHSRRQGGVCSMKGTSVKPSGIAVVCTWLF